MKKFFVFLAAAAMIICLAGCDKGNTQVDGTQSQNAGAYEQLNEMFTRSYASITVDVTDTFDGFSLGSSYNLIYSGEKINVSYTVERLRKVSLDAPLSGDKTTLVGEVLIEGDKTTLLRGDDIGLSAASLSGGLVFKEEYFRDPNLTSMYLRSDVADPDAFFGKAGYRDMHVDATFMDFFYKIVITCTAPQGNGAEIVLTFGV